MVKRRTPERKVVSLRKKLYSPKVLVIPKKRWLRPDITEKLLTGTFNLNTNKQIIGTIRTTLMLKQNIRKRIYTPVNPSFMR